MPSPSHPTSPTPAAALRVIAIHAGPIQSIGTPDAPNAYDRPWSTAFFKSPITSPIRVTPLGLTGDDQANKKYHGGPDQALLAYSAEHYPAWCQDLGRADFGPGGFAENLTITGQSEASVCLGDTYQVGPEVIVQVTAPRAPCSKIDRRWKLDGLSKRVGETQRTGWYLRVIKEGQIAPGDAVVLLARPHPALTIAATLTAHDRRHTDREAVRPFVDCPELAPRYRASMLS
jgi:MOSC domain-containing protein YiiM